MCQAIIQVRDEVVNEGCSRSWDEDRDTLGRYLNGKIVGLGVRMDIVNDGDSGIKGESMQQEEFGARMEMVTTIFSYFCRLICFFLNFI